MSPCPLILPGTTSRYSRRTQLLVQQALDEQERIGWDKAFRGYLSLTWGLLETPHEVPNPYDKTPQPSAWVISTLTNIGTFSKAMWKDRCTKLHDPSDTFSPTSSLDADISHCYANPQAMWKDRCTKLHDPNDTFSPTSGLDADISHCYANPQDLLAADRQLLNRPISKALKFKRMLKTRAPRPSSLSCRAPQSAVYYTSFLRPISSHSRTHCSSHSCSISCTPKSHASPSLVKMDPARVE
jgi:hypothetical protein